MEDVMKVGRVECTTGKSYKFWEYKLEASDLLGALEGRRLTVAWGRIGKTRTEKVHEFASNWRAEVYLDKKLSEKLAKGYTSKGAGSCTWSVHQEPPKKAAKKPLVMPPTRVDVAELAPARGPGIETKAQPADTHELDWLDALGV